MLQQGSSNSWRVCADMDSLPLLSDSLDAVFSNFAIQWSSAPSVLFKELHRVCKSGGSVVMSSVLEGSLKEVAQAWQAIDTRCHVNQFLTLEQIKRFAQLAGFDVKLAKQICLKDEFDCAKDALKSIKHIGASHIQTSENKHVGLMGKERFAHLLNSYPLENNKAKVSYEVALLELIKP
jgi:malonyl-CoA O-methyltransferase